MFLVREQVELVQYSWELVLGNVTVLGAVEILEVGFHEHSAVLNFGAEMVENLI